MNATPVYAAVLALMFVGLGMHTARMRSRLHIGIGHGDDERMLRAMRVHSNFAEYVPFALLLMFFAESTGMKPLTIHILGACLILGRCAHAYGVSRVKEDYRFRTFGMTMTFGVMIVTSINLLASAAGRSGIW